MESVKQRIADLESAGKVVGGLSLSSEFELACLRELVAVTEQRDALVAGEDSLRAEAFNDLCKAFVLHKQSACLDDNDKVSVREATDALLHCAEQLARQLRESKGEVQS